MPRVRFHHADDRVDVVDIDAETSLMRAAVVHGVSGIVGECGGQAMCATCHVYVQDQYLDQMPKMSDDEDEMLDCTTAPRDLRRSRLACQLKLDPDHVGLNVVDVDIPERQV